MSHAGTRAAHPILGQLLGDAEVAEHLSAEAEIAAMLAFEAALADAEGAVGMISSEAAAAIVHACRTMTVDGQRLAEACVRDGVAVPELVRQLRAAVGEPHGAAVHKGATSQDVTDTALMLRMKPVSAILSNRLAGLDAALAGLEGAAEGRTFPARTRMRSALPAPLSHRFAQWRQPLSHHRARLDALAAAMPLQLGGPVGTRETFGGHGAGIERHMAAALGLSAPGRAWHTDRTPIADIAATCVGIVGSLGKIGQDIVLMFQDEVGEIVVTGGGGSSAMAHKVNPVKAEVLVALARLAPCQQAAVAQALVAEQERSGAAWTLEWLALPDLVETAGAATRLAGLAVAELQLP